jgi:hypothetical protein
LTPVSPEKVIAPDSIILYIVPWMYKTPSLIRQLFLFILKNMDHEVKRLEVPVDK